MNNIIYPGSDIKPEACTEVISWQHDKQLHRSESAEAYKDVGSIGERILEQTNFNAIMKEREREREREIVYSSIIEL